MAPSLALPAPSASGFAARSSTAKPPKEERGKFVSYQTLNNVTGMIKWHLLRKIEADEIIPNRLAAGRASSGYWCRGIPSRDTLPNTTVDENGGTQVESFEQQNLQERISFPAAATRVTDQPPSPTPLSHHHRPTRPSASTSKNLATLPAPLPQPRRSLLKDQIWPTHRFAPSDNVESLFFHSTPCSMNMPTFRHGRIRIPKPDSILYANIMPDKTLDWTAFQVAILGGAGDFFSGSSDLTRRPDDDERDDITAWFDDFGFESAGRLVRARHSAPAGSLSTAHSRERSGGISSISSTAASSDVGFPVLVVGDSPHGCGGGVAVCPSTSCKDDCSYQIKMLTSEERPKQTAGWSDRDGGWSPPQSPMMELAFFGDAGDGVFIPMGYNLGHDLNDFLEWASCQTYGLG